MYGCNKLYCEQLGHYYARFYKQLSAEPQSGRVDFRAVRFPGLISAVTVPSGGTSDYAPEMIHAAARGEAYACFVRPDARIPFMAMPDGVEALFTLAAAPRERLTQTAYNLGAFAPTADEIRAEVLRAFPSADITYKVDAKRQGIVDSWPADVDDAAARRDWGFAPAYDFTRAFRDYLIPTIRGQYQTENLRSPAGATIAESARASRILRDSWRRTGMSLAARERHEPSCIGRRARLAARARLQAGSLPAAQEQRGRVRRHAVQRGTVPHGAIDRIECCRGISARR